ncbi:MAG: HAD-IIA family hydrolase [Bacteroidota bacterium]
MQLTPFRSLIDQYEIILFDSYGVIKNYDGIIGGAEKTLEYIHQHQKKYRVLTNDASSSPERLSDKFIKNGIQILPHRIITSGMMARNFLETKTISGKVLYLGTEYSSEYIMSANKEKISISEFHPDNSDEIGCIVFLDDEGYNWQQDINKVVNLLRTSSIPVIVANSDLLYPVSENAVSIATGAIASLVEQVLGRKFIRFGKPDVQMYIYTFEELRQDIPNLQKQNILMVGDTLHTDILGGIKFGIDTALVFSGNTSKSNAEVAIRASGISPDYVCENIGI